jgi:mannose-6-phosphate isomerase-like protein (cupin superfamily)
METGTLIQQILDSVDLPHCSILKNGIIVEKPGNSIVHALLPSPSFLSIVEKIKPSFSRFFKKDFQDTDFKFGINHVRIEGPLEEELHVHISCIIAICIFGSGTAIYEKSGEVIRKPVSEGDIIIVPQNAPHYFVSENVIIYTGIEIGPIIDYQKHHKH